MTTPKSSTEQDAHVSLIHAIAHYGQFPTPENHRVCADCIDAYAEAVRAAERARLASLVRELTGWELDRGRGWGCSCAMKREAFAEYYAPEYLATGDVLRLLTEDTAR